MAKRSKWPMVKLGEVATYVNGCAFKPSDWSQDGLPIIRIQNLTESSSEINYFEKPYNPKYEVNNGDILISWSASLGVYEWSKGKAILNQHIFKVVFDKLNINKRYFFYVIEHVLEELKQNTHGSTMKHITKSRFDNVAIPLPPIEVQREIARVLDAAAELIKLHKKRLTELDTLIQSVFYDMFGEKHNYPIYSLINLIQEGAGLSYGIVQPGDDIGLMGVGIIRPIDIKNGSISNKLKHVSKDIEKAYVKTRLDGKEILITVRGTTGATALTNAKHAGLNVTRGISVIRHDDTKINKYYLNTYLNTRISQQFIETNTIGATLKQINLSKLRELPIIVPPMEYQNKFAKIVQLIEVIKNKNRIAIAESSMLLDSLRAYYYG